MWRRFYPVTSRARKEPAATRRLLLAVPPGFSFGRTVCSHGWFDLPPFAWDDAKAALTRTLALPEAGPATARVTMQRRDGVAPGLKVALSAHQRLGRVDLERVARDIFHMLRLDEDLGDFHRRAGEVARPDLRWIAAAGSGRLLRSPTVFEDLVKMICTTNCTWALTKVMVTALVERLGEAAPGGARSFPSPAAMAGRPVRFYRDVVRAGYRSSSLRDLAQKVASGALNPEAWLDPARPTDDIRREILSVPGAGPYVADSMLRLVGRYDGLGIDSWCRRKFSQLYHGGRAVADRRIEKFYAPFGPWRGLAFWCDVTKDWFAPDGSGRILA
jgi:N-glycosylase/DNA lyase